EMGRRGGWALLVGPATVRSAVAIYWIPELEAGDRPLAKAREMQVLDYIATQLTPRQRMDALVHATDKLSADFGSWQTPWGEINRFQRLTGDIVQPFDDSKPSWPVAYPSANWGSLASFGMKSKQTT